MAMQRQQIRQREVQQPEVEEVPPSDPQEISFLPLREGRVWSRAEVERECRNLRVLIDDGEKRDGEHKHRVGTQLRGLYAGWAERAKGRSSFIDFAMAEFSLSRTQVYLLLRLAAAASEADARRYGIARCILGLRLLDAIGIQTFDVLEKKALATETGETVYFPATVRQLESALRLLQERADEARRRGLSRKVAEDVQRRNRDLSRWVEDDPALKRAKPRYVVGASGEAELKVGPLGREGRKAFARLLQRLVREES